MEIVLPRKDADGNYYISYSQYTTWKEMSSFNMGVLGRIEYMTSYFFGVEFPDAGWAQFGSEVEDYICHRTHADKFTEKERETLEKIVPLGNFQVETRLWILPNVYVKGFIDDAKPNLSKIRDYKTASNNSKQRYYKDEYVQLDIYSMFVKQETEKLPDELEVCIIERIGNCFGMVDRRDKLSVGTNIWYHPRTTSDSRIDKIHGDLVAFIYELSNLYKLFLQMNKIGH